MKFSLIFTVDDKKVYVFPREDIARLTTNGEVSPGLFVDEAPTANFIAKLHPAPIGSHTVRIVFFLSAEHCDGFEQVQPVASLQGSPCLLQAIELVSDFLDQFQVCLLEESESWWVDLKNSSDLKSTKFLP